MYKNDQRRILSRFSYVCPSVRLSVPAITQKRVELDSPNSQEWSIIVNARTLLKWDTIGPAVRVAAIQPDITISQKLRVSEYSDRTTILKKFC